MQRVEASGAATFRYGAITAAVMLASMLPLAAANAQTSPVGTDNADEEPTIIVKGERELEIDELRDAVRDVAMRGRGYDRPLSRYQAPLCPVVVGMGERMGAYVSERIRTNAIAVGVDVADEGCDANAVLIVTDDQDLLIEGMRKSHPELFDIFASRAITAAQSRGDAAIVWSRFATQGPLGRDGGASGVVVGSLLEGASANAGGAARELQLTRPSSFEINYSVEKVFTTMVFDVDRLNGVHLDQLSDFATLRILGMPQPTVDIEQEGAPSILNLFDAEPSAAPMRMTTLDMAYLKGLYAMRPNEPSSRLESFVKLAYGQMNIAEPCSATTPCEAETRAAGHSAGQP
jgi:hypothetical protein